MEYIILTILIIIVSRLIPSGRETQANHLNYYNNEDLHEKGWAKVSGEKLKTKRHKKSNLSWLFQSSGERRRDYYRNEYLQSDEWKRKRYVVLKRDNWSCVKCGAPATQVHHTRYAPKNIGREPIKWLESVCKTCHDSIHQK